MRNQLITDLWWFIENVTDETPDKDERFFALRERVREMQTAPTEDKEQAAIDAAAEAQSAYWDAMSDLEAVLGCAVDSTQDLAGMDADTLRELAEED